MVKQCETARRTGKVSCCPAAVSYCHVDALSGFGFAWLGWAPRGQAKVVWSLAQSGKGEAEFGSVAQRHGKAVYGSVMATYGDST